MQEKLFFASVTLISIFLFLYYFSKIDSIKDAVKRNKSPNKEELNLKLIRYNQILLLTSHIIIIFGATSLLTPLSQIEGITTLHIFSVVTLFTVLFFHTVLKKIKP